ncbi:DUF4097 family beta strand repeat-containing protein [Salinibacterium hongtaonis]|uniref:Uncharacterized protein n=1 Tax=Homoserinimonas hongtaonis TaxID=2079791 RepID=A0A2U1SZF9_9MICO|nr:DUF4097 family beta strand repeat-containing protein [Salinibacterium hongtaonis]PWB97010.1 hypothetical protein DF220_03530 [Salinibacterium hongtaonis]
MITSLPSSARILAVVAAAALTITAVSGCVFFPRSTFSDDASIDDRVDSVVIDSDSGTVSITGVEGLDVITVNRVIKHYGNPPGSTVTVDNGTLLLEGCGFRCDVSYTIEVPAGTPVSGGTENGLIQLQNLGDVDVSTSNGRIELVDIDGDVEAGTSNGRIKGTGLSGGDIVVETSNGSIELALSTPQNVRAETSNGGIDLTVPRGEYRVDASTSNGRTDIGITDTPDADNEIELRSSNGSISVKSQQ